MSGRWTTLTACLAAGLAAAAQAQDLKSVEITPFFGYGFSGGFEDADTGVDYDVDDKTCYGGMIDIRVSENKQIEFFLSRQKTELQADEGLFGGPTLFDLDIDYYHLGGTYILTGNWWQPFVVATVGATHIDPDISGSDSLTRFSLGIGGGVRLFPTENFGLYLAGRGLFTFVGGDTLIQSEDGTLTVEIAGDTFWQTQLQAGVIFAF
ncbi:MAG TPA: outer membrane beta-barrel protein [Sedimentisphaerales bacterium]|nr:outer membrane beta-barrel protein [Sedimentisphaerales bacterium]